MRGNRKGKKDREGQKSFEKQAPRVAPKGGLPDIGCYERFVAGGFQVLIR